MCYVSSLLRGVATGGGEQGIVPPTPPHTHLPPLQFSNLCLQRQGYSFSRMFRNYTDQKSHNLYREYYNFWTVYGDFSFFLTI